MYKKVERKIKWLKKNFMKLIDSNFIAFNRRERFSGVMGVYMIFQGDDLIYVGSTNNFFICFNDMLFGSTHTLYKRFINLKECMCKIIRCSDRRDANALEHFVISVMNPVYNMK
jgi:hypothetical protein